MISLLMRTLPISIRRRLQDHPNLQRVISNTGWLFADRILRLGVGFFVSIWIARYLGPSQYGIYNYALAFVGLFSAIAALGLDNVVIRNIVHNPSSKSEILGTSFILKLMGAAVDFSITVSINLLRPEDPLMRWVVIVIAFSTVFQAFDTIDFWFQSQVQAKYTVYAKSCAFVPTAIVKVVLLEINAPLLSICRGGLRRICFKRNGSGIGLPLDGRVNKSLASEIGCRQNSD